MERLFNIKSGERESFPLFELSKLESRGNSDKIELIHSIERIKTNLILYYVIGLSFVILLIFLV